MNKVEFRIDTILKVAVCLAMIGSIVGCGGNMPSLGSGSRADGRPAVTNSCLTTAIFADPGHTFFWDKQSSAIS
jgi:hypothetical protein